MALKRDSSICAPVRAYCPYLYFVSSVATCIGGMMRSIATVAVLGNMSVEL